MPIRLGSEHAAQAYMDEQNIIKTGMPIIGQEEREDWPDGRTTWGSTSKMPLYDNKGNIIGTFGITRDITEKKLVQERIQESEQVYRSLFENSVDGMFLMTDVFWIAIKPCAICLSATATISSLIRR